MMNKVLAIHGFVSAQTFNINPDAGAKGFPCENNAVAVPNSHLDSAGPSSQEDSTGEEQLLQFHLSNLSNMNQVILLIDY